MKKSVVPLLIILLVSAVALAPAQQRRGDVELQFYGQYYQSVGRDIGFSNATVGGKIGPYITDHLQIGIGPTLSITGTSIDLPGYTYDTTEVTFGSSVFFVYSFLTSGGKLVPYFGAQYFKRDFNKEFKKDSGTAGINGGIKYFFARKTALDFSINYGWDLTPKDETLGSFSTAGGGILVFAFGLSFLL
jgi:hypothetical protein